MHAGVKNSGKSVTEILVDEKDVELFDGRRRHEEHRHHAADLFRAAAVVAAGLAHGTRRMAVQPPGIERRGDVARPVDRAGKIRGDLVSADDEKHALRPVDRTGHTVAEAVP